ncbi:MAG: hypothetical protein KJZ77_06165 [Anaerolineales bacterium]|nr:hypothetical protein [Anaerolineales bacterium]
MNKLPKFQIEKLATGIEDLGLNRRAYHLLKRAGIHHVSEIITCGEKGILAIKNMGGITASHIFSTTSKYLSISEEDLFSKEISQMTLSNEINYKIQRKSSGQSIENLGVSLPTTNTSTINLTPLLAEILRNERTLQIIELRSIKLLTLEEIAVEIGVTRERVRQIIDNILEKVRVNLNWFKKFCDYFEEQAIELTEELNNKNLTVNILTKRFSDQQSLNPKINASEKEIEALIVIVRLLVIHEKYWSQEIIKQKWKNFAFLACVANPQVKKHEMVSQSIKIEREKSKKISYKELVLSILSNEKKPMHWSEIASHAYRMKRRESFNSTALYNALMSHEDLFIRVDTGTYALVEWGINQVDTYPNIIAAIMKSHNKPLSAESVYHKVNIIRPIKQATLTMLLELHPRFYKSQQNTYGLRVWLPAREKQTLRTPEWLVEDRDSYKRLELAKQRGYDVSNIIKADLDDI